MQPDTVKRVMQQYGYVPTVVYATQKGYRNTSHPVRLADGRLVNLILYKRESGMLPTIQSVHKITDWLAAHGLPVRHSLDPRIMRIGSPPSTRYAVLYNYISGYTLTWDGYTRRHVRLLGSMMSTMHAALQDFDSTGFPHVGAQYIHITANMNRYFDDPLVAQAMQQKLWLRIDATVLRRFQRLLEGCMQLPGQRALHMDFVRSNIIFEDMPKLHISGLIDFEKTAVGHPVFDAARTLAFLLVDCRHAPFEKTYYQFLIAGYQRRGVHHLPKTLYIAPAGQSLLERLITLFLAYDFYKFLRHNPYESLPDNEHYIRTVQLLIQRGVITTTPAYRLLAQTLLQ